jgi:hypothetical protein
VALLAIVVLFLHAREYRIFFTDDGLISLRYSQRLLEGHGLTWTAGERVEGYSNLLWVLLVAGVGGFGIDLIDAARIVGFAATSAAICAVVYAYRPSRLTDTLPSLVGTLTIALSGSVAAWTVGGLEQPLLAGMLAWGIALCLPLIDRRDESPGSHEQRGMKPMLRVMLAGVFFGLVCLTRPDGPLFTVAAVAGLFLTLGFNRNTLKLAAGLAAMAALFWVGQLIFRLAYYGEWVPNTALVKAKLSPEHLDHGWRYIYNGYLRLIPMLAFIGAFLLMRRPQDATHRRRLLFLLLPLAGWTVYMLVVGGDIFLAWRHFVPIVIILALIAAEVMQWLQQQQGWLRSAGLATGIAALMAFGVIQHIDPRNRRATKEHWQWDGKIMGNILKTAFGPQQPLLGIEAAGCIPFWSELPCVDMLGLNDHWIPRHPPKEFGKGYIGHELGDGMYLLRREPDLFIFHAPYGSFWSSSAGGKQMQKDTRFWKLYTPIYIGATAPDTNVALFWVKRESQKIGIRRSAEQVVVPGFLFNGNAKLIARLDAQGRFGVDATAGQPARIDTLRLTEGTWRVEVAGSAPARQISISRTADNGALASGASGLMLTLSEETPVNVEIAPTGGADHIREVVFRKER